jgi:ferrous iron transport protein B
MRLSDLSDNERGIIFKVRGRGAFRKRILEMGFVKGKEVKVIKNAPLKDPVEYEIMGYEVSLRRSEASLIDVVTPKDAKLNTAAFSGGIVATEVLKTSAAERSKVINIAFVGNPNSGKTTIFNYSSKSREHVGNYGGVTIDLKTATFKHSGYTFNITDLPGTYSLSAYSPEELYVRDYIIESTPDVVINIVDASNLERNLYLTTQLIDMDIKVIIALNMYDDLIKKKDMFDFAYLGKMIGIPFIPTVGPSGKGIKELFEKVIEVYNDKDPTVRHIHINYGQEVEESINNIQDKIKIEENYNVTDKTSSRFIAIKLLENDTRINRVIANTKNYEEIISTAEKEIKRLEIVYGEDSETIIADAKYGFLAGALKETYKPAKAVRRNISDIIDNVITHKYLGYPIFILFMWIMFSSTFVLGQYPMDWIDKGVIFTGNLISKLLQDGILKDLIIEGIIGGVGSVIVYLPNILILFLFISFMEDTGYMARVAFIMDKLMHKIGLHGKSFIPLVMGFGCNVPAIMSTRVIENRNNRLLTMLINPFMSCSARLPVYILLIGAFFPKNRGTILFLIYLSGIVLAICVALILKRILFRSKEAPFVMELPPYRMPTLRSIIKHMWYKASQYLRKIGGVILIASVIVWILGYFPRNVKFSADYDKKIEELNTKYNAIISSASPGDKSTADNIQAEKQQQLQKIKLSRESERKEKSYIGHIGRFVEPAIRPLGFDWKMGVSLITGIVAKEIVISTMGVIYQADNTSGDISESLPGKLQNAVYEEGKRKGDKVFTSVTAISFLMFILIYFPCIGVIAAIRKESGSPRWAVFALLYTTSLAWLVSFLIFQIGTLIV